MEIPLQTMAAIHNAELKEAICVRREKIVLQFAEMESSLFLKLVKTRTNNETTVVLTVLKKVVGNVLV